MRNLAFLVPILCVIALAIGALASDTVPPFPFRVAGDVGKVASAHQPLDLKCGGPNERAVVFLLGLDEEPAFLVFYKSEKTPIRFILVHGDNVWVGSMDGPGNNSDVFVVAAHLTLEAYKKEHRSPCGYLAGVEA